MNEANTRSAIEIPTWKRRRSILMSILLELCKQHPQWPYRSLHRMLYQRRIDSPVSLATVIRWCRELEQRQPRREENQDTAFGGLWISAVLRGPVLTIDGKKRKTSLLGILDDASRFMISASFHLHNGIDPLMIDLRQALLRFGVPRRFSSDNGTVFRRRILHQIGAELDIAMHHAQPDQSQGRGKMEPFFRSVRGQLLANTTAKTLEQLNHDLQECVTSYHQAPHEGIAGETPFDKRLHIKNMCHHLPETVNIDALFLQSRIVRIHRNETFRLGNSLFKAPNAHPDKRIRVFYHSWDLSRAFYGQEHWVIRAIDRQEFNRPFEQPIRQEVSHE